MKPQEAVAGSSRVSISFMTSELLNGKLFSCVCKVCSLCLAEHLCEAGGNAVSSQCLYLHSPLLGIRGVVRAA